MRVQRSVEINRPLAEVFDYVSDVGNYPQWMAHVLAVREESPARFVVTIKSLGRRFETPYERTAQETEYYTDRAVGGPIPNHRWSSAFAVSPTGTVYTRRVDVESRGVLKLLEPLQKRAAGRQLEKDLQTLKRVVEKR